MDYTACIEQEYGFCGTEYYQELETGSFSLTNSTDLHHNPQDTGAVEGAKHGEACVADYLLIPGGHCKVKIGKLCIKVVVVFSLFLSSLSEFIINLIQ